MYRKSEVHFEPLHLDLQVRSAGCIFNNTRSSLDANTVNMFVCLRIVRYPSTLE